MPTTRVTDLLTRRLGNRSTRQDLLGQATFPGLTIDNLTSTPISSGSTTVEQQIADLAPALSALNSLRQNEVTLNTAAMFQRSTGSSTGSGSFGGSMGDMASSLLGGLSGLAPVFEGLFSLFGGGGSPAPQPLVPFLLPDSIRYAAGTTGPGSAGAPIDYGQGDQVRTLAPQAPSSSGGSANPSNQTVTVNVNAMDSRSFLDHSDDIASAVRKALLDSHPLTDVISSL